jgi:hypothetical protein
MVGGDTDGGGRWVREGGGKSLAHREGENAGIAGWLTVGRHLGGQREGWRAAGFWAVG